MLTGTELGAAIESARKTKNITKKALAERFGIKPPSVQGWVKTGRIDKATLIALIEFFSDSVPPSHWGLSGKAADLLTDSAFIEDEVVHAAAPQPERESGNVEAGPETQGLIPLISWVQAGAWSEVVDQYAVGDAEQWLPCPAQHSPRTFALRVRGESMFDPHGRRSFREGDVVYVDPDRQAENGSLVIAKLTDSQEATFKQLVIEDGARYLKALNPAWPERMMPINGNCIIVGVVFSKVELF